MSSHRYSDPTTPACSATASAELKLYQAFIFSVPIFFTFILLLLFYFFYLRSRRVDWSATRMPTPLHTTDDISRSELGLKKELREMLPIIIFKESFSVRDNQCSVCLSDYQAEDRLQQIPACGHTFHMNCIDNWLATHTTCPLCRLSLLDSAKASTELADSQPETSCSNFHAENGEISLQVRPQACDDPQISQTSLESRNRVEIVLQTNTEGEGRNTQCVDSGRV